MTSIFEWLKRKFEKEHQPDWVGVDWGRPVDGELLDKKPKLSIDEFLEMYHGNWRNLPKLAPHQKRILEAFENGEQIIFQQGRTHCSVLLMKMINEDKDE